MSTAVLYRWKIHPGREDEFERAWRDATRRIHLWCGSFGARLHRAADGEFWSYARWPDEDARRACFEHPQLNAAECFDVMRACVAHRYDEVVLDVCGDELREVAQRHAVPTLTTERLTLRPLTLDDAASIDYALSDAENMRFWSRGPHESLDETRDALRANISGGGMQCFGIVIQAPPTGLAAAGWVNLIDRKPGTAEIGYILRPDVQGHGYAREAVAAVVEHGFTTRGLRRIWADTDPENAASIRLLEALGFEREGHLRAEWETHIGVRDTVLYARIRLG